MLRRARLILALSSSVLAAQRPAPRGIADSSIDRIIALASPGEVAGILRPVSRAHSRAKLDSLADRLTARAIGARGFDGDRIRLDAIEALRDAGLRVGPHRNGIPYDGAADRLIRIHRESPLVASSRSAALWALTQVVGFDRSSSYLHAVAGSSDPTAWDAMGALTLAGAGTAGVRDIPDEDRLIALKALRQLWDGLRPAVDPESGAVVSPTIISGAFATVPDEEARRILANFAAKQGWIRPR
jgi:hypothetical protein